MKTTDVPHMKERAVAETAKKATSSGEKTEAPEPASTRFATAGGTSPQAGSTSLPLAGGKATASESGDPGVHQALARLQAAQQNRDALGPPSKEAVEEADKEVEEAKKRLADLGYPQD